MNKRKRKKQLKNNREELRQNLLKLEEVNKRKRKKQLKNNREELRQNLLKLEEVTAYLQKQGVFSLDKFQENDWHLLILDDDLKKFSKKFSANRLIGAVLMDLHDEWIYSSRKYINFDK